MPSWLPPGRIRAGCLVIVSHAQRDPPLDLSAALSVFAVAMHTMNNTLVMHNFDRFHDMMMLTFSRADQEHKGRMHHIKVAHEMLMQLHWCCQVQCNKVHLDDSQLDNMRGPGLSQHCDYPCTNQSSTVTAITDVVLVCSTNETLM